MAEEKAKLVKIKLPLVPGVLEDDVFVGDNGKTYLLQRGVETEAPQSVAEILETAQKYEVTASKESARLQERISDPAMK